MKKLIQRYYPGYVINKPAINRRHELKEILGGMAVMTMILALFFFVAIM